MTEWVSMLRVLKMPLRILDLSGATVLELSLEADPTRMRNFVYRLRGPVSVM
jgi:hypothetical protein